MVRAGRQAFSSPDDPRVGQGRLLRQALRGRGPSLGLAPGDHDGPRPRCRRTATRVIAMFEVRIHGRGGQGVVTTAELLSVAAFTEGRQAQAFPTFGSERTGAPVVGFCRIDDHPIRTHEPIAEPDAVIVQDATLIRRADIFEGLRSDGYLLLNTSWSLAELG